MVDKDVGWAILQDFVEIFLLWLGSFITLFIVIWLWSANYMSLPNFLQDSISSNCHFLKLSPDILQNLYTLLCKFGGKEYF